MTDDEQEFIDIINAFYAQGYYDGWSDKEAEHPLPEMVKESGGNKDDKDIQS